ncbi:MAG TPA: biopolymer transporter ExbD [Tepidisphaeraceae bacterium]|jgi:biopolymer transport protein ExbD|nr:biopolymer transporter ExbD [Tepidisphaeraceae bacterium]
MAKRHIPQSHGEHPNVTPLIDVVMVLIVFFMLVARIGVNTGADETITIPKSIQGTDIKDMGNALVLNVKEGQLDQPYITALVRGTNTELKVSDPTTKKNQLVETLMYFRNGDKSAGIAPNDQFKVVIRGAEDMQYRFLEPVLLACAQAKVKEVAFNTGKVTEEVQ